MDRLEIKKMSTIERLQTMEALWDSFTEEDSKVESPEWHRDILEERKRKIEDGKAEFISLKDLRSIRNL
ncbi:MAG: addiction module protein [Pseudomonadota bacterium]